ncbi:Xaa-Pro peptidase family protein [uncultured Clostridium sp.]|uniref:M24 family metallopeptidase n=1 Tax=uncultured Clostridium sp. TaxID=59620 RepID=UPI0028EDCE40|nr:Xaa-Pro peptidase family protein [uncultured Clostridium sp.]
MYKNRIDNLRNSMKSKEIDGILLIGDHNRNYISGFTGDESYVIIGLEKSVFITDSRYTQQAKEQVEGMEIREYKGKIEDFLRDTIAELNIRKIGFEENIITYKNYIAYKESFNCEMVPLEGIIEELRVIKDNDEIECIKKAASIADKAFDKILQFIRPGVSEKEVAVELEYWLKRYGGSGLSFPSIVASGERSALPHGEPTDKVIRMNDFVTLDFGCIYKDYCSDMTRTLVMGNASEKMLHVYNTVLKAQEEALKAIRPGLTGTDVDKVARDIITSEGYGKYFGHGLGHGVGREVHENPRISPAGSNVLKPGMVITDEPGIYIPNEFGVRIEDLVLVTEDGYEVLSKSPKNLIII